MRLFKTDKYTVNLDQVAGLRRYEFKVPEPQSGVVVTFSGGGTMRVEDPAAMRLEATLDELANEIPY
jgi:hypothetical protein